MKKFLFATKATYNSLCLLFFVTADDVSQWQELRSDEKLHRYTAIVGDATLSTTLF